MEIKSRTWSGFNAGIKTKLFNNFREYKKKDDVSSETNVLEINPVEQSILQGSFLSNETISIAVNNVTKLLIKRGELTKVCLRNRNKNKLKFLIDSSAVLLGRENYDDLVLTEYDGGIFMSFANTFYYSHFEFELSSLQFMYSYNRSYYKLILYLFAYIEKTYVCTYFANHHEFDQYSEQLTELYNDDDITYNQIRSYESVTKKYNYGYYRELYQRVQKCNDNHSSLDIIFAIESLKNKFDKELNNIIDSILCDIKNTEMKDIHELYDFQAKDELFDTKKYRDAYNHLFESYLFIYDFDDSIANYYHMHMDAIYYDTPQKAMIVPFIIYKDGTFKDYSKIMDSLMRIFKNIKNIEKIVYGRKRDSKNNS